ncbi:MAG: hypothetical protein QXU82_02440 [Candidatus Aenigmatarchaeota archaeon]
MDSEPSYAALAVAVGSVGDGSLLYQRFILNNRVRLLKREGKRPVGYLLHGDEAVIVYEGNNVRTPFEVVAGRDAPPLFESSCVGVLRDSVRGRYLSVKRRDT